MYSPCRRPTDRRVTGPGLCELLLSESSETSLSILAPSKGPIESKGAQGARQNKGKFQSVTFTDTVIRSESLKPCVCD